MDLSTDELTPLPRFIEIMKDIISSISAHPYTDKPGASGHGPVIAKIMQSSSNGIFVP